MVVAIAPLEAIGVNREQKSINGLEYEIYEQCARDLGLVHDVDECTICMHEALDFPRHVNFAVSSLP